MIDPRIQNDRCDISGAAAIRLSAICCVIDLSASRCDQLHGKHFIIRSAWKPRRITTICYIFIKYCLLFTGKQKLSDLFIFLPALIDRDKQIICLHISTVCRKQCFQCLLFHFCIVLSRISSCHHHLGIRRIRCKCSCLLGIIKHLGIILRFIHIFCHF